MTKKYPLEKPPGSAACPDDVQVLKARNTMRSALFGLRNYLLKTNLVNTGTLPVERLALTIIVLILLTLPPLPAQGAESWSTTRFEVFAGPPFMDVGSATANAAGNLFGYVMFDEEDEDDMPHPRTIEAVERAFSEAASWYKRKGFPPPDLVPILDTEDGPAYRVYLCKDRGEGFRCGYDADDGSTKAGMYYRKCDGSPTRSRIIYLNRDKILQGIGLNELGYQTIAHELMHAIIANTAFGRDNTDCPTIGRWIREGLPDAISYDIMEELWDGRYSPDTSSPGIIKAYGYRPYLESLPQRGNVPIPGGGGSIDAAYTSSSFWRFIKNSHSQGWKVLISEKGLLSTPMSGRGWRNELKWLDKGLRRIFSVRLQDFYVSFVSYFAYAIPPMESYSGTPPEQNLPHWSSILFGECEEVDLASASTQDVILVIEPLATRCLWVQTPNVPGTVKITFSAQSADVSLFKEIIIGLPGQAGSTRGIPAKSEGGGTHYGTWLDFPQDGSKRQLYLVSNFAREPGLTNQRAFTLTAMLPANMNSAMATVPLPSGTPVPPPEPPSYKKHAKTLTQQRRARSAMARQQLVEDKKSLTTNTASATDVSRRPNMPECTEPFKYDPCGPHIVIGLNIVPGSYLSPGQVSAEGGMTAQVFSGMQALAETSLFDSTEMARQLSAQMDAIDGSSVGIAIPMIDYGYSGTISNASIRVDMSGGRNWHTFGPPDQNQRTRLTGRVTIEEYTPHVMRGTFVAPLAEFTEGGQYTARDTVTGSFTSVAPWRGDGRFEVVLDSVEEMADEIANTMGLPADMIQSMKQDGTMPGSSPSGSGASSVGSEGVVECTCECKMKPFADELCELLCEEEFAACESP